MVTMAVALDRNLFLAYYSSYVGNWDIIIIALLVSVSKVSNEIVKLFTLYLITCMKSP